MEENLIFESCNVDKIKCKDCKWSILIGYLKSSCIKYERKPYDVYYKGEDCPKFEKKED